MCGGAGRQGFYPVMYSGFVHLHYLKNPGFSRTFFILFPGVFQEYLKYIKQTVGRVFLVFNTIIKILNDIELTTFPCDPRQKLFKIMLNKS